jgi:type IV secretory pathway TraG/TraD family ATPase VirD4
MTASNSEITYLGENEFRNQKTRFGIKQGDRLFHTYVIGKTGTGKSTLIETFASQDIENGRGFALFDPHGDLFENIRSRVLEDQQDNLILFDTPRTYDSLGFNPLSQVPAENRLLVASGLLSAFRKMWSRYWGPRMEHFLRNALLTLLEYPEATLADLPRLFLDKSFRLAVTRRLQNKRVGDFWRVEYAAIPLRYRTEAVSPILTRIGAFLSNPILYRIVTNRESIRPRQIMDDGQILLVNLSKGKIGEDSAYLLGAMMMAQFEVAALSRADTPEASRRPFHIYLDEFQSMTTKGLSGMLSELRKYRVSLFLAHQYVSQVDNSIRDAIFGNVGTIICFRIGPIDARLLEKEFGPRITAQDLVNMGNYRVYVKLMIDGVVSKPFSAVTMTPADL